MCSGNMEPKGGAAVLSDAGAMMERRSDARRVGVVASSDFTCSCPRRRAVCLQSTQAVVRFAQERKGLLLLGGGRARNRVRHSRDEILGAGQRYVEGGPRRGPDHRAQ